MQAVAEARHSALMAEAQSNHREQVTQLQAQAISSATQLRLELLQAEHRLQQQEEQLRTAGESLATKHSEEVSQMQKGVMDYKIRLHQAEAHASEIVRQAERELANRAKASQSHAENMTGELNHLKSEMGTVLQAHRTQSENVLRLERTNADLRARLAEAVAASPTNTATIPPVEHPIHTPPGLMQRGGGPPGGDGSPPGSDGDDESDDDDHRKKKNKKKKKDKKKKKKKRDSSDSSSSSSIGLSKKDLLKMLKKVTKSKKDKDNDEETEATRGRSKVQEAEKIVFPKFPQPENYRNWRLRAREAVVAASDRPDEAFEWLDEVWKEDTTEEYLRDPKGFTTLDAKILSAITNVLEGDEGDFARQIDTFKEREGHEGRLVRGRQILHKLNAYLSTNALHGSVYDMEDLLNFVMINENLVQFIRNWDTVLSGMKKSLADDVLQPLFHRQVKKAKILSHDIAIYERAVDGSTEKTYEFLYNAVNRLIKIKRLERNRERIAKQAAAGMPSAPAPLKRVPKGFCIDFVRNGSCSKDQCTYKHQMPNKPRGRSQSKGKGKGRGQSPPEGGALLLDASMPSASSSSTANATRATSAVSSTRVSPLLRPLGAAESPAAKRRQRKKRRRRSGRSPVPALRAPKAAKVPRVPKAPEAARARADVSRNLRFQPPFVSWEHPSQVRHPKPMHSPSGRKCRSFTTSVPVLRTLRWHLFGFRTLLSITTFPLRWKIPIGGA